MKVCIINNIYPPYHRGGAEQVVVKTVEGLLERGHEVVIITSSPQGNTVERDGKLTIYRRRPWNIYFYTDAHNYSFALRFVWHICDMFNFFVARWVRNILQKEQPDIVHTHNLIGLSFLIPSVIRKLELKHIHTVHDVQLVEPSAMILKNKENSWRYTGLPTKTYTWIMKKMMGSPHVVISPSQFLLDFYMKRGFFQQSQKVLVRNPLTFSFDARNVDFRLQNKELREKMSFNFIYLGQIEMHKGIFLLIEAFKKIQNNIKDQVKLHIIGNGSQLEEVSLQAKGNDHIHVYGRMEHNQLPELFKTIDVAVVPSLCYENSPTVIFESLYFGIPVLASRIEGIAELIHEGENGITFSAGDVDSLAEKMKWCLEHKQVLREMSNKTQQSVLGLGREEYVKRLLELY